MFFVEDLLSVLEVKQFLRLDIVRDFGEFFEVGLDDTGFHGGLFDVLILIFFVFEDFLDLV